MTYHELGTYCLTLSALHIKTEYWYVDKMTPFLILTKYNVSLEAIGHYIIILESILAIDTAQHIGMAVYIHRNEGMHA